jgi:uncharacterized protein YijF (DUF1287 family)
MEMHYVVRNLMIFFNRQGKSQPMTTNRSDGYLIVHSIGAGPRLKDVLLNWEITGHYRYFTN